MRIIVRRHVKNSSRLYVAIMASVWTISSPLLAEVEVHDRRTGSSQTSTSAWATIGITLDINQIGKSLGGWDEHGGAAADYNMLGSKYRTFKPEVSRTGDGLKVESYLHHIRGGNFDDGATLTLHLNKKGGISKVQASIRFANDFWEYMGMSEKPVAVSIDGSGNPVTSDIKALGKLVKDRLLAQIPEKADSGRRNFALVIEHNYNVFMQNVHTGPRVDDHRDGSSGTGNDDAIKSQTPIRKQSDPDDGGEIALPDKVAPTTKRN